MTENYAHDRGPYGGYKTESNVLKDKTLTFICSDQRGRDDHLSGLLSPVDIAPW